MTETPLTARRVATGDREILVREAGSSAPDAPTVILVTGAGDVSASWIPVMRGLARSSRVVAYDRFGMSDPGGPPTRTLEEFLTELSHVIEAVTTRQVFLVGHSFGGLLVRLYAEQHPARVAGLVLIDVTPEAVAGDRGVAVGFALSSAMASLLKASTQLGLVRLLLRWKVMPLYPEQRRLEEGTSRAELHEWKESVNLAFRTGAAAELRSVLPATRTAMETLSHRRPTESFPVTLITSKVYGRRWVQMHDDIAAEYPGSIHLHTGRARHNIHLDDPALVVDTIRRMTLREAEGLSADRHQRHTS